MKVLTLNVGSSSVKYALFERKNKLLGGIEEKIGLPGGCKTHDLALKKILSGLLTKKKLKSLSEIKGVGHRVVHGGSITKPVRITKRVKAEIRKMIPAAPLHNPPELTGIQIAEKLIKAQHIAVFDTAFHATMPEYARQYALPKIWRMHFPRYGFHGLSYEYLSKAAVRILGYPLEKVIICHLGNGASVCAVKNGKSIDTSMGFTPTEGLMMGTRSGDLDPGIVTHLAKKIHPAQLEHVLNFESGLKGVGGSRDMRIIQQQKSKEQRLAFQMFCYRLAKYIGAYTAALNGLDCLVFSAGIGEHAANVRQAVTRQLSFLDVRLNKKKNQANAIRIDEKSKVPVLVIPTDEQQVMAEAVLKLVR